MPTVRIFLGSMARIPIEDNFDDVINKTQRGLKITDEQLASRAEVSAEDLAADDGRLGGARHGALEGRDRAGLQDCVGIDH